MRLTKIVEHLFISVAVVTWVVMVCPCKSQLGAHVRTGSCQSSDLSALVTFGHMRLGTIYAPMKNCSPCEGSHESARLRIVRSDMAPRSKRILILGATGVIGEVLARAALNDRDQLERVGVFTSAATAASKPELLDSFRARGANIVIGDINDETAVRNSFEGTNTCVKKIGHRIS